MAGLTDIAIGADDPKVVKIVTNNQYGATCAQTEAGGLRCWGYNGNGRLGAGIAITLNIGAGGVQGMTSVTDVDLEAPADTVDSADLVVTDFSVAQFFCVLNSAGQVKCVGNNDLGVLGLGNTTATNTGTGADYSWMDFGSKVVALASGAYDTSDTHTCALTESGEIYCWGGGTGGALGYSNTDNIGDNELPTDLPPVSVWGPAQTSPDTVRPSNLIAWYDAADISTLHENAGCSDTAEDGDTVLCWQDKTSGLKHLNTTGLTGPSVDYDGQHGLPTLTFDGSENLCIASFGGLSGAQEYTIFMVMEWEESTASMVAFEYGTSGSGTQIRLDINQSNNHIRHSNQNSTWNVDYPGWEDYTNEMNLIRFRHSAANNSTGSKRLAFNGYMIPTADSTADGSGALNLTANVEVCLGAQTDDTVGMLGQIAEVIIYDSNLNGQEAIMIENYLKAKWQKGLDGMSTTGLHGHYDPMKAESLTTDVCATGQAIATDGSSIQCWQDRSPMQNHMQQITSGNRPVLETTSANLNSKRVVSHTDDFFTRSYMDGFTGPLDRYSSNVTFVSSDVSTSNSLWSMGLAAANARFDMQIAATSELKTGGQAAYAEFDTLSVSTPYFIASTLEADGSKSLFQEGIAQTTGTDNTEVITLGDYKGAIGANVDGGADFSGEFGDVLIYDRPLNQFEMTENTMLSMKKYGATNDYAKAPGGVHHGLVLWLDADDGTTVSTAACTATVAAPSDTNPITCWKDKSGKANHVSSDAGSPTYQADEFNTKPVIRFTGTQNMSLSDLTGMNGSNESFTVFAVANRSQTTSATSVLSFGDNETSDKERWAMRITANGRYGSYFRNGTVSIDNAQIVESANKHAVITMSYDGGGVNEPTAAMIYENGASISEKTGGGAASGDAAIATTPMLHIGSQPDNTDLHGGDIAEVIIYTRLLSAAERQQVEAYLANKWMEEPYYTDCIDAENSGETAGTFTIDTDGYNGPRPPFDVTCNFSTDANLAAWWKLDETTGSSAAESAGSNTGTLAGGTLVAQAGRHGGSMAFDGTDDVITTSYAGITGPSDRSISAWIKPSGSGTWRTIVSWGNVAVNGNKFDFQLDSSDRLYLGAYGRWQIGTTALQDDRWYHVALTFASDGTPDTSEVKLYVNGVEESYDGASVAGSFWTQPAGTVTIGNFPLGGSSFFNGNIDDVRIYNDELSAAEVLELYKQGER